MVKNNKDKVNEYIYSYDQNWVLKHDANLTPVSIYTVCAQTKLKHRFLCHLKE